MPSRLYRKFSLEELASDELEVNKLMDEKTSSLKQDDFDTLYTDLLNKKDKVENEDNQDAETPETTPTESQEETPDTGDNPSEDTSTDEPPVNDVEDTSEDKIAEESFLQLYTEIATEDLEIKEKLKDALTYLKELGFHYTPIVARGISKGVIFTLSKSAKALLIGSNKLIKLVSKRINNFKTINQKINKLNLALDVYKSIKDKEKKDPKDLIYKNKNVIPFLRIENNYDFYKNSITLLKLLDEIHLTVSKNIKNNINDTNYVISNVIKNEQIGTLIPISDHILLPQLKKVNLPNLKPATEHLETVMYQNILPGNIAIVGFTPKKDLEQEDVISANIHANLFLTTEPSKEGCKSEVPFMSIKDVENYIHILEKICNHELFKEKYYNEIVLARNTLKPRLGGFLDHLYKTKDTMETKEQMSRYIASKIKFIDSTYISLLVTLESYTLRYLNESTQYCKDLIKSYS